MAIRLRDKNVGDIVKIKENGAAVNFIIVHKGLPSEDYYDSSCEGIWLLREDGHSQIVWDTSSSSYKNYATSSIYRWLNNDYLSCIDSRIRTEIKTVILPYISGAYGQKIKDKGLSSTVFLLGCDEVGHNMADMYKSGVTLSYFQTETAEELNQKRVCKSSDGTDVPWWLRNPHTGSVGYAYRIQSNGGHSYAKADYTDACARPAFILPEELLVDADGNVYTNNIPVITSDKAGDLGTLSAGFTCNYSVDDEDEDDPLTVTLTLDGVQLDQFDAERNEQYSYTLGGDEWLRITDGEHTFKIIVSDGKDDVENVITFTRNIDGAVISLEAPLEADDVIRACSLFVKGSLPMDIELMCEVTNNGNDSEPVWEDCTVKVKAGVPYMFKNQTAENGFAFNFRVAAKRGLSDTGGYITEVSGGFE